MAACQVRSQLREAGAPFGVGHVAWRGRQSIEVSPNVRHAHAVSEIAERCGVVADGDGVREGTVVRVSVIGLE